MRFNEDKLEQAIIALMTNQGYRHYQGSTLNRQPNEVLLKTDLMNYLIRRYSPDGITEAEIDSIIRRLELLSSADLYLSLIHI